MNGRRALVLVHSTSHAIKAEKLLKRAGIANKLIPTPRHLSSDCGICVQFEKDKTQAVVEVLERGRVDIDGVFDV